MDSAVKNIIEENINDIDTHNYKHLYSVCPEELRGSLTAILREANIDIFSYITEIPVGMFSFYRCKDTDTITIPLHIKAVNSYAFRGSFFKKIILNDNIEDLGGGVFQDCSNLESINLPEKIEIIYMYTFLRCKALTYIHIPENVETIDSEAFAGCYELKKIDLPSTIKTISTTAFSSCHSLEKIEIPNTVKNYIPSFDECSKLSYIQLPEDVNYLPHCAFRDCFELTSINYQGTVEKWNHIKKNSSWLYKSIVKEIICLDGTVSAES